AVTPLTHTAALSYALACLHAGASVVLQDGFDEQRAARAIAEQRVSVMLGFPPMATRLFEVASDVSSLRLMLGYEDPAVAGRLLERFPQLRWMLGNFGQTETHGMAFAGTLLDAGLAAQGIPAGREMPLTRVRITGEAGREAPPGEVGEIAV